MNTHQLFAGIVLLAVVLLTMRLTMHIDAWRSAVSALSLRWEREQRQAAGAEVPLAQRQAVQTEFEHLVANRPSRVFGLHAVVGLASVGFVLAMAWNLDDLRWTGLWLVLPMGITGAAILGYGSMLLSHTNAKLAAISTTLYGPAPPRVKVRAIQSVESENGRD